MQIYSVHLHRICTDINIVESPLTFPHRKRYFKALSTTGIYIVSSIGREILPSKFTYSIFILLEEKYLPDSLSGDKGSMMLFFSPAVKILLSVKRAQKLSKLDTVLAKSKNAPKWPHRQVRRKQKAT